jgi:TRAP-type mannitol/chloroaromatic compound transport system substrate-binding protein
VLERLGVKPVNIAPGETYTALERGVVDAVEWIAPYNDAAMGLHRIAPFYYTGWHEPCAEIQLIVNRDVFAVLPEDLKAMIPVAAKAARLDTQSEFFYRNAVSWQAMAQEGRVKLRTFPDDVIAALRRESQALLGELARSSPELKEILDGQSAFLKRARAWTRFTEQAYLRIR